MMQLDASNTLNSKTKFALGFVEQSPENRMACHIPLDETSNIGVFGTVGFGKTETLKRIVQQCLQNNIGFTIIENHNDLSRDSLALMASRYAKYHRSEEVAKHVIYMAPQLAPAFEHGVKVNPLQLDPLMVNAFIDLLKHIHDAKSWGDRLETIIRRAVKSLLYLGEEYMTINVLWRFIADQSYRNSLLPLIPDKEIRDYWLKIFDQQYKKDAGGAAINKLDRLLGNDLVAAAMAMTQEDRDRLVDLQNVIRGNKIFIADLAGMDNMSAGFLGGVLLMMFYTAAERLAPERTESTANPYFLIVDEAHLYAPILREVLNRFRKLNIKVVFATQTLDDHKMPFANEINELVPTVASFRVGRDTARRLTDTIRRSPEELATLPKFRFALYSAAHDDYGTYFTRRIPLHPAYDIYKNADGTLNVPALQKLRAIMKKSAEIHGSPVRETFMQKIAMRRDFNISLTFAQYALLVWLMKNGGSAGRMKAFESVAASLAPPGATGMAVKELEYAANQLFLRNFVGYGHVTTDAPGTDGTDAQSIHITGQGMAVFFSSIPRGQSGGGQWHVDTCIRIVRAYREQYFYCILDVDGMKGEGDVDKPRTDVLVIPWKIEGLEPAPEEQQQDSKRPRPISYSFDYDNIRAFEVESNPSSHPQQVFKNWDKNFRRGYAVTFVVRDRDARDDVYRILETRGISRAQYAVLLAEELPEPSKYFGLERQRQSQSQSQSPQNNGNNTVQKVEQVVFPNPSKTAADKRQKRVENRQNTPPETQKAVENRLNGEQINELKNRLQESCKAGKPDRQAIEMLQGSGYRVKYNRNRKGQDVIRVRKYGANMEDTEYIVKTS